MVFWSFCFGKSTRTHRPIQDPDFGDALPQGFGLEIWSLESEDLSALKIKVIGGLKRRQP